MKQYRAVATWKISPMIGKTLHASSMWYSNRLDAKRVGSGMTGRVTIVERDYTPKTMPGMVGA